MSQPPPQYPPASPPPGGGQPGGWSTPPGGQPPGGPGGPGGGPERRKNKPLILLLVAVAVVVVGGGIFLLTRGGGRSDEEQAYIDALTEASEATEEGSDVPLDGADHRCLAEAAVDTVGVERLREAGTPEEMRQDREGEPLDDIQLDMSQAETYYDHASDCVDFRDVFLGDIEEVPGITQEQIDCVNRSITDEILRDIVVANFAEDEEASERANQAADEATADCDMPGG